MVVFVMSAQSASSKRSTSVPSVEKYKYLTKEIVQVLEINNKYSKKLKKVLTAWEAEYVSEEDDDQMNMPGFLTTARERPNPPVVPSQVPADGSISPEVETQIQQPAQQANDWILGNEPAEI